MIRRTALNFFEACCIVLALSGLWLIAMKGSFNSLELSGPGLFWGIGAAVGAKAWYLPTGLNAHAFLLLAIIVLVGTLGAFTLFLQRISMVEPVSALLACLEPLTAAFLSAVRLGSVFTIAELIGVAFVLATVFLLNK